MTLYGWDASHYDSPDPGSAYAEGIRFFAHKAGGDKPDPEYGTWWRYVRGMGDDVLLMAYWVLYPGYPQDRADAFIRVLDDQSPGWRDRPFGLQADCEKWNGDASTVPGVDDINAFCDRLRTKVPKLMPIAYVPKWVYGDSLRGLRYPTWASSYVNGSGDFRALYPGDSSARWGAYSQITPSILQYSSTATIGGQTTCDANAFRGTLQELISLLAPGWADVALTAEDGKTVWGTDIIPNPKTRPDAGTNPATTAFFAIGDIWRNVLDMRAMVANLQSAVTALAAADSTNEQEIVSGVLAGLDPVKIADAVVAALPDDQARQVVDELTRRLQGQ